MARSIRGWLITLMALLALAGCGAQPAAPAATSAPATAAPATAVPATAAPATAAPATAAPATAAPAATTAATAAAGERQVLRLATTTSTADSGLLDAILPEFEQQHNAKVDVVAVGTGQALKLGENGDADVVLVHARAREDEFVAKGFGINRRDVMYNDFILVGPKEDPAGVKGRSAIDAFKAIADKQATFASRGDDSGTHTKELSIWSSAGITPTAELGWYKSLGQGMGETLITANEQQAYTLADRGTYLSMRDKLPNLAIVVGGETISENKDRNLLNPYGVIPVNPEKHPGINIDLAEKFAAWLTSKETQAKIGEFGKDRFGQSLFFPNSAQWWVTEKIAVDIRGKTATLSVDDLRALPKATVSQYRVEGRRRGYVGTYDFAGAALKDVLLKADPDLKATDTFSVTVLSNDGFTAELSSAEVFGAPEGQAPILAYERDGKPMTAEDGLVQLVVPIDKFADRYSHWVSQVEVK